MTDLRRFLLTPALCGLILIPAGAVAFDSGSDGSDGALSVTDAGTFRLLDVAGQDANNDGIYEFTTITIGADATIDLRGIVAGPVHWLAAGDVVVDGTILLDGRKGHDVGGSLVALPGAGGFSGGFNSPTESFLNGRGPGGGRGESSNNPAGAGFLQDGPGGPSGSLGLSYGNHFLLPLIGGSGGGAGSGSVGTGGGAGGGAGPARRRNGR